MTQEDLIANYIKSIQKLKQQYTEAGMSEDEFRKLYMDSLNSISENSPTEQRQNFISKYKFTLFTVFIIVFAVYNFKVIYNSLIGNLQEFIYPILRFLRGLTIPLISLFPVLTEFYQETCLIHNPFFTVVDMDCWPCSSASNINVREVDDFPFHQNNIAPFIYQTTQQAINLEELEDFYIHHKEILDNESSKVWVNKKYSISPNEMFKMDNNLYIWKFNTMNTARILRQIIARPNIVPKFGQSTERFIIVDSSQESFQLPDTECNYSFLLLLNGTRTIDLIPAEECKDQCKSLNVELKETYLLWYNWWYWRPVVQPTKGNVTLIAHVGSYC